MSKGKNFNINWLQTSKMFASGHRYFAVNTGDKILSLFTKDDDGSWKYLGNMMDDINDFASEEQDEEDEEQETEESKFKNNKFTTYLHQFFDFFQTSKKGFVKGLVKLFGVKNLTALRTALNNGKLGVPFTAIKSFLNIAGVVKTNRKLINKLGISTNLSTKKGIVELEKSLQSKRTKLNSDLNTLLKNLKFVSNISKGGQELFNMIRKHPNNMNLDYDLNKKYGLKSKTAVNLIAAYLKNKKHGRK